MTIGAIETGGRWADDFKVFTDMLFKTVYKDPGIRTTKKNNCRQRISVRLRLAVAQQHLQPDRFASDKQFSIVDIPVPVPVGGSHASNANANQAGLASSP